MTAARRILIPIGLAAVVIAGATPPASATYAGTAAVPTTTIATATVAAPTQVEAKATCETVVNPTTGAVTSTVHAKIEWHRSDSRGVSGYRVTAHLNNGASYVLAQTDARADEVFDSGPQSDLAYQPTFSITTLTTYGWTAVSARSGVLTC